MIKLLRGLVLSLLVFAVIMPAVSAAPVAEVSWTYNAGSEIKDVAISEGGKYTAVVSEDRYLHLINSSEKLMWKEEIDNVPTKVAISSGGEKVFAADGSKVYLFNKTGDMLWKFLEGSEISALDTTSSGDFLAAGSISYQVYLLDGENGDVLWKYRTNGPVMSIAISRDSNRVVAGTSRGSTYMFDSNNGRLLWEYNSKRSVNGVEILNDRVVSGERYLNFLKDGNRVGYFMNIVCDISGIETTSDGMYILVGCENGEVYFMDISKDVLWSYDVDKLSLGASISPEGSRAAVGGGSSVYILSAPDITSPEVQITGPEEGEEVSGIVKIDAAVTEDSGYTVRVLIDGSFACSKLPCDWNTWAASEGEHEITVEIKDARENIGEDKITVNFKPSLLQNIPGEISEKQKIVKEKLDETVSKSLPPFRKHRDYGTIIKAALLVVAVYIAIRILRRPKTYKWKKGKGRGR